LKSQFSGLPVHRHAPRRRGIQYAAASRFNHRRRGILDRPPEPLIGRAFARPVSGR